MTGISVIKKCLKPSVKLQALAFFVTSAFCVQAQKIATLEVELTRPPAGISVPVRVMLDPLTTLPDAKIDLLELRGNKRTPVDFQVEKGTERILTWMVSDETGKHVYELVEAPPEEEDGPVVEIEKSNGAVTLRSKGNDLVRYHYQTVYPPAGIDSVYGRSGFIHPLWSPRGQVLTRIQPPDHYHHYGLWNPWTHVLYEGDTIDFWNLNRRQGTVRFADFASLSSGDVFGEYAAIHEHVAFDKSGAEVALLEVQTVRVYAPRADDSYIMDITVEMTCPESPVRLLEYRYGGIGWRATEAWTKANSSVLSSEGKTRKDADGSKARWCIVEGEVDGDNAGAVMMSYPLNFNHPEPLRIWPENANRNRGDMFANFSPTKDRDWPLQPGQTYVLKYRFVVFDGEFSAAKAEAGWQYFASPPLVRIVKHDGK